MPCNRAKSRQCFLLLFTLLVGMLAACGGDEPAPAPPPPPPPPPAFQPQDVKIDLGTSGESLTLQTTESGGYTRNGEAFASGTTVEAAGNTYRLTLENGEWTAEYVAPRPWAIALGRSGDALLITQREDGLFEAGDEVFSSGGTVTASNDNQYRLTLVEGTWQVEYLPPEPVAVLLGMSGETVLVERLEGGGFSVGEQRVVDGSTVKSASGSDYRLTMQDGTWTATFVPPPPITVQLGASGQTVMLQRGESGQYELNGQPFMSGGTHRAPNGNQYVLTMQDGTWTAMFVPPPPITVQLGASGQTVMLQRGESGQYELNGQPIMSGGTHRAPNGNEYVLTMQDGAWTATFKAPAPVTVALGTSGETVTLQIREDGQYYKNGQLFRSGSTETTADGNIYQLVFSNGTWTATFQASATVVVELGTTGETVTLVAQEDGTYTRDGTLFRPNTIVQAGGNSYRLVFEGGEWRALYDPERIPVLGGGDDLIILFLQEDGTYTYNNEAVSDGSTIDLNGTTYELTFLPSSRRWVATRISARSPASVDVGLPNGETITLTRNQANNYEYQGSEVQSGSIITVGGVRYELSTNAAGDWSAQRAQDSTTIDTGAIGGPTRTDEVDDFTAVLFDSTGEVGTDPDEYGVQFRRTGDDTLKDRGTKIVPRRLLGSDPNDAADTAGDDNIHEFPVFDLVGRGMVAQERTYVEVAKAQLGEIITTIQLSKPLYDAGARDPDDHIGTGLGGGMGLWNKANAAIRKIFAGVPNLRQTPLGNGPWSGCCIESDEVDSVIRALQDMVEILSDLRSFEREFDTEINTSGHDAEDFFSGVMSRIRFGSTTGTRFGAYAVKQDGTHAATGNWDRGVFAYTPLDQPERAADLPTRGEATFRGDTVATGGTNQDPELYAGKIELVASFARGRVNGTVTQLKDEDGRTWEYTSTTTFVDEPVESISLPAATSTTNVGFYSYTGSDGAKLSFTGNFGDETDGTGATFRVQLIDDAAEALGVWKAFNLEGSFGATRTGDVRRPTLPTIRDPGYNIEYSRTTVGQFNTFTGDDAEDNNLTLTKAQIGEVGEDDPLVLSLRDLFRRSSISNRGSTYFSVVRSAIVSLYNEAGRLDPEHSNSDTATAAQTRLNAIGGEANTELAKIASDLSVSFTSSISTRADRDQLREQLRDAEIALRSKTAFTTGHDTGEIFAAHTLVANDLDDAFIARTIDFELRFDKTAYTRFGVWSQIAPQTAFDANATLENGAFAYSPLAAVTTAPGLSFVATYSGRTFAVDRSNGNIYRGGLELRVDWRITANNVTSTITDLRGVGGRSGSGYLQHDSRDVNTIFLSGISASTGSITESTLVATLRYRDGSPDSTLTLTTGSGDFDGSFIDVSPANSEGPVGVTGTWGFIETGTGGLNLSGAFGADLKP